MPAPTTADELLELIQKSNLVEAPRLNAYAQKLRETASLPADPTRLAQMLVRDALLTFFQAEQLLQGKYKRFSLGKYKVLERLGSGGMGTVFLCEHKLMRRRVAVKVLPVPKAEDRASLDRFLREARAAAAVDHPNIVRAYDIDQDENLHFLVMEWVDGTNLQDLVKKFGPLDVTRACHYVYGAAVGLQHAHEIGLIHRDIKPGNILVDRSGVVKILDLGLARLTQDTEDNLTRQNDENVLGTADYLAPEQAMDSHTVDVRADIYSLGATFYFLLTGSPPFPEGSVAQKLIWHQNRPPRPLKSLRPEVPDELAAVVEKMMAKEQAQRYRTPAEVMQALAPWVATPIPPPADREMPTLSPAVAGGAGGSRTIPLTSAPALGGMVRTLPSAGATTMSGMPTTVATVATPPPLNTPAPHTTAAGAPAVWSTLDTDTQSVARGDTDKPGHPVPQSDDERPSRVARRAAAARQGRKRKVILFASVGVLLFVAVAVGVYFAFLKKTKDDPPQPPPPVRKVVVSKAGGDNTVPSLREALLRVGAGETIVIAEAKLSEPGLRLDGARHKDITIESATPDGKPAVIEFLSPVGGKGGVMFEVRSVEGLRVRNVEFDGRGQAERGVQLSGFCPGTTFEGVTVRRVQKSPFHLWNVAGDAGHPVTLDQVRALLTPTCEGGIVSTASGGLDNKFITIRNSRFEGPGRSGVRLVGPALDVELSNNRFYNLNSAVSFAQQPSGRVRFTNNTVYQAQVGFLFEVPGPDPKAKGPPPQLNYNLTATLNYFAKTPEILRCPVLINGLNAPENLHDPASGLGKFPPESAAKLDAPVLPDPNPSDDANFLRFPDGNPPAGPNKPPVGAK